MHESFEIVPEERGGILVASCVHELAVAKPKITPASQFVDKADSPAVEGDFEWSLFIWIVLAADVSAVAHPFHRRSRR